MGSKGIVASSAALGILMQQGIGDTIRISLTPEPGGDRTLEVKVAQEILQTMGFRVFVPLVAACPGCGRTTSTTFQELARDIQSFIHTSMPTWKTQYPGVESLNVAVMGCIVNGPGESKHADIGISLPGTGETPAAPVFIDGKKAVTLRGADRRGGFQEDGDRLYREAVWGRERRAEDRGGVEAQSSALRVALNSSTLELRRNDRPLLSPWVRGLHMLRFLALLPLIALSGCTTMAARQGDDVPQAKLHEDNKSVVLLHTSLHENCGTHRNDIGAAR